MTNAAGVARHLQRRRHLDAPLLADLDAQRRANLRRAHPRRPYHRARLNFSAAIEPDHVLVDLGHPRSELHLHTLALQRPLGRGPQCRFEWCQQRVGCLQQHHADLAHVEVFEVLAQHEADQLGIGAGHLHAGWTAAHDREREQRSPLFGRLGPARRLETRQHAVAQSERFVQALEPERVARHRLVPEEVGLRASGQHEEVVRDRAVVGEQQPALQVCAGDSLPAGTPRCAAASPARAQAAQSHPGREARRRPGTAAA